MKAAEAIGVNIRHFHKMEAGTVNATLRTQDAICEGFGLAAAALFD